MTATSVLGQQGPQSATSDFNATDFHIQQRIGRINTSKLVLVIAVHGGGVGSPPTVDVQPMVNQIDGAGNATPHGIVYGIPCFRLQGGNGAAILDPVDGDIGWAGFCDTDTSIVRRILAIANPGSRRRFSLSDGVYFGGCLNGTPSNYVQISSAGIVLKSAVSVTINAPTIFAHATSMYAQDVGGYGQSIANDGSGNITINTYYTGATVTTNSNAYDPPEIPV